MGRVRKNIKINGRDCWTLFDTGSRNTYIVKEVAKMLHIEYLPQTQKVGLGGKINMFDQTCVLIATIEGKMVSTQAFILDEIGKDEDNQQIEILFGALAMQQWGIRPIRDEEILDMSKYPKEFIEFVN